MSSPASTSVRASCTDAVSLAWTGRARRARARARAGRGRGDEPLRARLERHHVGERRLGLALQRRAGVAGRARGRLCALAAVDGVGERQLVVALADRVARLGERGAGAREIRGGKALGARGHGHFDGGLRLIDLFVGRLGAAGGGATEREERTQPRGGARTRRRQEHQTFEYR